ncbi:HNH endonuclease [Sphingomonas abaci]|uniref:HNH endonuclease n=1 Tax=Sphingomonas abaci TaxID=237611 RepID=A0A7W7AGU0_9SPHN|nr:HNH endonuclease signature motif containing protein [Sphingomonas abaci]MBB4616735.1 hypothetical protein [Sphingomonas abaci]
MINAAVTYADADKDLVDAFEALPRESKSGDYWSEDALKALKGRIKSFYIAAQGSRCCYCDRHQGTENHRAWDVEHIVDRAKYAWFLFTPRNLAAACPDCNLAKSETEVLKTRGRKTYPSSSADFKIVHPHFDQFNDHIFHYRHVYIPKTPKGSFTIYTCKLLRFAEKYIDWQNSAADTRFEAEVNAAFDSELPMAVAAVNSIANQLSQPD